MDEPDHAGNMRAMDHCGNLNGELEHLERVGIPFGGRTWYFAGHLTGDCKNMQATNGGGKCWDCDEPDSTIPNPFLQFTVQWGAVFRCIKGGRRVGDYAHATCRFLNNVIKHFWHSWSCGLADGCQKHVE